MARPRLALTSVNGNSTDGEAGMSVVLRFRNDGPAFDRAKAVADAMGLSIEDYLMACIAEGNKVLRARHLPLDLDMDEPTFIRWGIVLEGGDGR